MVGADSLSGAAKADGDAPGVSLQATVAYFARAGLRLCRVTDFSPEGESHSFHVRDPDWDAVFLSGRVGAPSLAELWRDWQMHAWRLHIHHRHLHRSLALYWRSTDEVRADVDRWIATSGNLSLTAETTRALKVEEWPWAGLPRCPYPAYGSWAERALGSFRFDPARPDPYFAALGDALALSGRERLNRLLPATLVQVDRSCHRI